ncbi:AMP-binding protein [Persephonella sp.]|uniref:AMP-binding protein n=1 Tax=Persephonella sp. TaxID=2060922 RepID=UPI0026098B4D|nr:AMP-binding protein [Persephonella sp.]
MIAVSDKSRLLYKDRVIKKDEIVENIHFFSSNLKINPEDRVCIYSYNRPEWIYSFFAVWEKGGIPVPIDFMSEPEEIKYIIQDCQPRFIFTEKERIETLKKAISLSEHKPDILIYEEIKKTKKEYKKPEKKLDDTAVILYTSGTTGKPKGVMLTYKNLLSNINGLKKTEIADSSDSTVAILPFHHSYPLMVSMLFPLHIGAGISFIEKLSAEEIIKTLQKDKITVLIGVPRLYQLFHRKIFQEINKNRLAKVLFLIAKKINNRRLSKAIFRKVHQTFGGNIKYFVSGGAKLDVDIAKDLWALGFTIIEGYGLTETSPIVSFNPPEKIKLGSAGKPIEGVSVKIEDGEIVVKGNNIMKGYWKKPEETAKVIRNGWFYTGDLGHIDQEGYIYITGRKKDIIVLPSGKNINPEEIEQKLLKKSELVKEVAVILENGRLTAIIYPDFDLISEKGIVNIQETIKWNVIDPVNRELPDYKRISGIIIVRKELPKTRLGKVRRFLLDQFLKETEKPKIVKEPDYEEYRTLKDYLKTVTKREIYPYQHIEIDLGLDSLEKVELLSFIENSFGIKLTEEDISKNPTVEKLSEVIKNRKKKIEKAQINWSEILKEQTSIDVSQNNKPLVILKKVIRPIFKIYFSLEVEGQENIPDPPFIMAPNHQSFLDGFLLISAVPDKKLEDLYFLAEEIYFPEGIRKKIGKIFHVLTVNINKDLKGSLLKTASLLREGKSVVIFPEGARTRDGNLLPFKKAFGILSKQLNIPVVPVVIKGAFEAFPIGSKFPNPHKIKIKFLKPIYPEKKDIEQIVAETYEEIKKNL